GRHGRARHRSAAAGRASLPHRRGDRGVQRELFDRAREGTARPAGRGRRRRARGRAVARPGLWSRGSPAARPAGRRRAGPRIVSDLIDHLVAGAVDRVTAWPDGTLARSAPPPRSVLPGSFNPLHDGHLLLARVAEEMTGAPVAFEISVTNVDKPPLAAA